MKAKQSGGPARLDHRCFAAYGAFAAALLWAGPVAGPLSADPGRSLDDFAQVYVDQFFEPGEGLKLNEDSRRRSQALAHYALGRTREARGETDKAVEAYSEVLRHQPDRYFLARKTAYLLARSGREEEALKLLEESLARNADQPFAHIALSEYLATYHRGEAEGLKRSFEGAEEAVRRFPDEPAVYEHLVKLFLSADRREEAKAVVAGAVNRDNRSAEFWLRLGRLAARVWPLGEGAEPSDAAMVNGFFAKALDHAGDDVSVAERVGDFYQATGQFDLAVATFSPLIAAFPDRLDLRQKLAQVYAAQGDEENLIRTLSEIVEIDPQNADVHKQIAGIHLRAERFKEAIPHLRSALAITKGSAEEYGALGRMMIESREFEASAEFLTDAAYLFPESPDFPFLLTFSYAGAEQWPEAVKQFQKTLELAGDEHPQLLNEGFYFRYAAAHERSGDLAKAEELFRKTIEMIARNDPDDENQGFTATVYNYLGYMWLENDMKIDEAGELIKTAAELDPESGAIADSLGWFYFKKGKFEAARDELLRAETLIEAEDAVIFDHIGQVFHQLGEKERAVEYLEKAVALDPEKEEYRKRLEDYKSGRAVPAGPAGPGLPAPAPAPSDPSSAPSAAPTIPSPASTGAGGGA